MTRLSDVGGDKYRRIWLKVIAQAYMDAVLQSRNPVKKTAAKRARAWITAGDADFKEVCALAGLDYKATQIKLIKAIKQTDAARHATRSRAYGAPLRLTPPVCRLRARRTSQHYASAPSLQDLQRLAPQECRAALLGLIGRRRRSAGIWIIRFLCVNKCLYIMK